jgi:hypothetical protein
MCVKVLFPQHVVAKKNGERPPSTPRTAARWFWGFCRLEPGALLEILAHQSLSTPALFSNQKR